MNHWSGIGRLTKNPELGYLENADQTPKCIFSMAIDRPKRNGENAGADFIRVIVWGKQGENCDKYLSKGRLVAVEGAIRTGSYKNKEGKTIYTTDVVASRVEFLPSPSQNQAPAQETPTSNFDPEQLQIPDSFEAAEDDIPF